MKNFVKISFVGDLMCQKSQLEILENKNLSYDLIFEKVAKLFADSDYVVGNLETPIAGKGLKFTTGVSFNTPIEFVRALKKMGISFVSTANNHSLDRGIAGLENTISNLRNENLDFSGTYLNPQESEEIFVKEIAGIKFAFLCSTYSTNSEYNGTFLPIGEDWRVDLLKKQSRKDYRGNDLLKNEARNRSIKEFILAAIRKVVPAKIKQIIKILLSRNVTAPTIFYVPDNVAADEITNPENAPFLNRQIEKIKKARTLADVVIAFPHVGGQYNAAPGLYEKYIVKTLAHAGTDLVIAGHAHTSLRCEKFENGIIGAYALGNFCFTPYKDWFVPNTLAEYSIVLHTFWNAGTKKLEKITFSVTKTIVAPNGLAICVPVNDLFKETSDKFEQEKLILENEAVVNRFLGGNATVEIQPEYIYPL